MRRLSHCYCLWIKSWHKHTCCVWDALHLLDSKLTGFFLTRLSREMWVFTYPTWWRLVWCFLSHPQEEVPRPPTLSPVGRERRMESIHCLLCTPLSDWACNKLQVKRGRSWVSQWKLSDLIPAGDHKLCYRDTYLHLIPGPRSEEDWRKQQWLEPLILLYRYDWRTNPFYSFHSTWNQIKWHVFILPTGVSSRLLKAWLARSPSQWVHQILSSQVDGAVARWEAVRLQLSLYRSTEGK